MRRALTRTLTILGACWLLLTFTPAVNWWVSFLDAGYSEEPRPILLVLAGDAFAVSNSREPLLGPSSHLRSIYAFWFWQKHHPETILISGGPAAQPTAAAMASYLEFLGVPTENIRVEDASLNTQENIRNSALLLRNDHRPITVLTSDFHMRRSILLARRAGWDVAPHPVPDIAKRAGANRWERSSLAVQLAVETAKLTWEWLRGLA